MENVIYMERAHFLAKKGAGYTSPNPMVGAVLVKNNEIIGEGYHAKSGEFHAEIAAIENATLPVRGATLYCNLEPCCHQTSEKRTPPCTNRIIREGIKKVVISTLDPNPHVSGRGVATLQAAGITVETGLLAEKAALLNQAFFKFIQTRQPFVHLKIAQSLDGRIATANNHSQWITDETARSRVHEWRSQNDAILVGANTVEMDNPNLTLRFAMGKQPLRIVADSHLRISMNNNLLQDKFRQLTHVFTTASHNAEKRRQIEATGANVHVIAADPTGKTDLSALLFELGKMHVTSLLVEGGAGLYSAFIREALFDKLSVFIAPLIIGDGVSAIGNLETATIDDALRLEFPRIEQINGQVLFEGYRNLAETLGDIARFAASEKSVI